MPYHLGIPYRDGEPIVYDSGDYPKALQCVLDAVGGVEAFRARQREARDQGRYLGLGIGCYVEGTGVGPFESAAVRIDPTGKIYVASGACPQGQGMETIFSQIVADTWKVNPNDVIMALADTSPFRSGSVRSQAAARSPCRQQSTMPVSRCAKRSLRSLPICWNARLKTSNCAMEVSALSGSLEMR